MYARTMVLNEENITADELFDKITELLDEDDTARPTVNRRLHDMLSQACKAGLSSTPHGFGNLFARLSALCELLNVSPSDASDMQQMRRDGNSSRLLSTEDVAYSCRALALLVSKIWDVPVPSSLNRRIPHRSRPRLKALSTSCRYLRCRLTAIQGNTFRADIDTSEVCRHTVVTLSHPRHTSLLPLLEPGMQVNLLDFHHEETSDNTLFLTDTDASLLVVEPDFLIDISAIARCFTDYGHHPLSYTLNRLTPSPNSHAILLGNFAGRALDDVINQGHAFDWRNTFRTHFMERAIDYATCPDLNAKTEFKADALQQSLNIAQVSDALFADTDTAFHKENAILEPTFLCEELGLQGRVDLMTTDMNLLVEQKSGANWSIQTNRPNTYGSFQKEDHYVQLLLYYGVLRHNFHLPPGKIHSYLLYSKYPLPGGLVEVNFYRTLFHEAMTLRNRIVLHEVAVAKRGFADTLAQLRPDVINERKLSTPFFVRYLLPRLQEQTAPLHALSPLEQAYFETMAAFVYREQLAAKTGGTGENGGCDADIWQMPLSEKRETGNIYTGLQLVEREKTGVAGGFNKLTFTVTDMGDDFLPNFRRGDRVLLYAESDTGEPDARRAILYKGVLAEISTERLVVHLNDGQQNPHIFRPATSCRYAVEHAPGDMSASASLRSLYAFTTATQRRRDLLLSQRPPRADTSLRLSRSYHPDYDPIVLKAKQALDFFLLVGPPGTGKTSMALQYLVRELVFPHEYSAPSASPPSALLMAYTNRAVDEMCDMLLSAHIPFVRIGNEYACDERFRPFLLRNVMEEIPQLAAVRRRLLETHVFVGTTSTLVGQTALFNLKTFSVAIIDEAGQLLEPSLMGLLSAKGTGNRSAIAKFILIGDHKQLPAVVRSPGSLTGVSHPDLNAIGLYNTSASLFERLLLVERRAGRAAFTSTLCKQGRMHPAVSRFANTMFYADDHLQPVPLPHQQETELTAEEPPLDALDRHLLAHRMAFFPSQPCLRADLSEKVNLYEATLVATLLQRLRRLYGKSFNPAKTVGVIVPYRNQIAMIRRALADAGATGFEAVSIDTVERYQGSQRDIIIYSFTVQQRYQLAFLTANTFEENGRLIDRKLNVALTRARRQMLLTGCPEVLAHNTLFARLMADIRAEGGEMVL